jgi:hypothetical protein
VCSYNFGSIINHSLVTVCISEPFARHIVIRKSIFNRSLTQVPCAGWRAVGTNLPIQPYNVHLLCSEQGVHFQEYLKKVYLRIPQDDDIGGVLWCLPIFLTRFYHFFLMSSYPPMTVVCRVVVAYVSWFLTRKHTGNNTHLKGGRPGVWEITLFSVSSQIDDHLCVWKFPLNSKLLCDKDCLHWIWPVKKMTPFTFP